MGFILILYLISYFLKNPLNIGIGPVKLVFGGNKKNSDDSLFVDKLKSIVDKYKSEIIDLKYDTLRRQIVFAEEKSNDNKSLMAE
jgi:hypothetical protein